MFSRITEAELSGKGVVGQAAVPGLSVLEMQESVEQIVREAAIPGVNRLADELEESGAAANLGAQMPEGTGDGSTVQQALDNLASYAKQHMQRADNPHGVTAAQTGAYTKAETDAAIDEKVVEIGAGDMAKAVYGGSADGVVKDSDKLGGHAPGWWIPTGLIAPFAGAAAPDGWLLCDGAAVSRTQYAALFAVIGTVYGAGDGSSTFNLPDLRGRTAVGVDSDNAAGTAAGEKAHTLTQNELPVTDAPLWGGLSGSGLRLSLNAGTSPGYQLQYNMSTAPDGAVNYTDMYAHFGGGLAHNNMQPSLYLNYIIKT